MPDDNYITNEQAGDYLRNWIKKVKEEMQNNPEAFQPREPGLYLYWWNESERWRQTHL